MSSQGEENNTEDYDKEFEGVEYSKVTKDVVRSLTQTSWKYYLALGITFLFLLAGAGVYYYQTRWGLGVWGTNEPIYWGLDIPNFIFWIGLSHSGTLLSAILLLTRSNWRKPIYRSAEAMTFFALVTAQVVILTHLARPWRAFYAMPYPNIRTLWTNLRSALSWDIVAISTYMTPVRMPVRASLRISRTTWRRDAPRLTRVSLSERSTSVVTVRVIPVMIGVMRTIKAPTSQKIVSNRVCLITILDSFS